MCINYVENELRKVMENTPAILVFFWPFWPRSRLNILWNFTFESEAKRGNFQGNKRILGWQPFWNKVYE